MLLQTNSYYVPPEKRDDHQRLMRRFRQTLLRLGCQHFAVHEQMGVNFAPAINPGRFVQMMWFRDRRHHQAVREAESGDKTAQELIREFCELIDVASQQERGMFNVEYYMVLTDASAPGVEGK